MQKVGLVGGSGFGTEFMALLRIEASFVIIPIRPQPPLPNQQDDRDKR